MKMLATVFCLLAGAILVLQSGSELLDNASGDRNFNILMFSMGLYFLGKGLFVNNVLAALQTIKDRRAS